MDLPFADASWKVTQQWYGEFSADGRTFYVPTSGTEAGEPLRVTPFLWLCLPVKIEARDGQQIELVQ